MSTESERVVRLAEVSDLNTIVKNNIAMAMVRSRVLLRSCKQQLSIAYPTLIKGLDGQEP